MSLAPAGLTADMPPMIRLFPLAMVTLVACAIVVTPVAAQIVVGPTPPPIPVPAPPPPPSLAVPKVPQMDEVPQPRPSRTTRGTFNDRVVRCLDEGAMAGLNAAERAAYSRACANR
jgi:hypothetical protein